MTIGGQSTGALRPKAVAGIATNFEDPVSIHEWKKLLTSTLTDSQG